MVVFQVREVICESTKVNNRVTSIALGQDAKRETVVHFCMKAVQVVELIVRQDVAPGAEQVLTLEDSGQTMVEGNR